MKRFTSWVRYTGRQSKSGKQSKQGKGTRIVVVQAEVRSTSNHINQEEALIARNTRNSGGKKQGTYQVTTIYEDATRNKKTRTIYTHRQQITRDR